MADLEQRLQALGERIEFPATPLLSRNVRARLTQLPAQRRDLRWLAAVAVVALVTVASLLAFPGTRNAIAGFFGLKGVLIQRVPSLASPTAPAPGSLAQRLALGRAVSFTEAQAALPYTIVFPSSLGTPDDVFLLEPPERKAVALVWKPRANLPQSPGTGVGALLIEFPGQLRAEFFAKMIGPDASLEEVKVGNGPGYWISGKAHDFVFLDEHGSAQQDTFRLAGNTLIWERGPLTIRIESELSRDAVLALGDDTR
jgi:hypothetical protein